MKNHSYIFIISQVNPEINAKNMNSPTQKGTLPAVESVFFRSTAVVCLGIVGKSKCRLTLGVCIPIMGIKPQGHQAAMILVHQHQNKQEKPS